MQIACSIALIFISASLPALSQQSAAPAPPPRTFVLQPRATNPFPLTPLQARSESVLAIPTVSTCPLDMKVRQGLNQHMVAVDKDGWRHDRPAAKLHLVINDSKLPKPVSGIVKATVTVHGTNGRNRTLPAIARAEGAMADIAKTLTVSMTAEDHRLVSGEILLPGFTSTTMVDLESVTFANGESWTLSGDTACHVAPDPLMLVADR
jgi:hypothetical protein